jgi:nitrite reductase/ring-hydroxylating ferredoxin subunit
LPHASKKYQWFKIAESEKELLFSADDLTAITVNNKKITLAKHSGRLFACAYTCPHAGGILSEGNIDATGNIVCPVHRYKFSLVNGRNTSGEGYYLRTHLVEIREDGVFIGFEQKGLLNFS